MPSKVGVPLDVFTKSSNFTRFLKVALQKACFFSVGNLARPSATAIANHRSLIILESEPHHAEACLGKNCSCIPNSVLYLFLIGGRASQLVEASIFRNEVACCVPL